MAGDWQVHENRYVQTGTKPLTERDVRANVEGAVALRNAAPALLAVARAALAAHPEPGFTRYSCNGALDSALADLADAVLGQEECDVCSYPPSASHHSDRRAKGFHPFIPPGDLMRPAVAGPEEEPKP